MKVSEIMNNDEKLLQFYHRQAARCYEYFIAYNIHNKDDRMNRYFEHVCVDMQKRHSSIFLTKLMNDSNPIKITLNIPSLKAKYEKMMQAKRVYEDAGGKYK